MSELGNKIRAARNTRSQIEFAELSGISLRTLNKAEVGGRVKLDTVRRIIKAANLNDPQSQDLVLAWIKMMLEEFGDDFRIASKTKSELKEADNLSSKLMVGINKLPVRYQQALLKAIERPEVLNCLVMFNEAFDRMQGDLKARIQTG
jgi:hypothetical protein